MLDPLASKHLFIFIILWWFVVLLSQVWIAIFWDTLYDFMFDNCQLNWSRYHQFICFVSTFRDVTVSSLHFVVTHEMSSLLVTIKMKWGHLRSSTNVLWILLKHFVWIVIWYDMTRYLAHVSPMRQYVAPFARSYGWRKFTSCPGQRQGKLPKKHHQPSWNISKHLDTVLCFYYLSFRCKPCFVFV